jgi:uncharacterized protein YwgA
MDFKGHALILEVIQELKNHGSWTGKTHIQKAMFLLQEATSTTLPFDFVLYKHGPYSFDVETGIEEMRSYSAIEVRPIAGFGVEVAPGSNVNKLNKMAPLSPEEKRDVLFVAEFVGNKKVTDLERIATAVWIRRRMHISDTTEVADCLHKLKPHVTVLEALDADKIVIQYLVMPTVGELVS